MMTTLSQPRAASRLAVKSTGDVASHASGVVGCAVFAAACESGIVVLCSLARDPLAPHSSARLDGHTRGVRRGVV